MSAESPWLARRHFPIVAPGRQPIGEQPLPTVEAAARLRRATDSAELYSARSGLARLAARKDREAGPVEIAARRPRARPAQPSLQSRGARHDVSRRTLDLGLWILDSAGRAGRNSSCRWHRPQHRFDDPPDSVLICKVLREREINAPFIDQPQLPFALPNELLNPLLVVVTKDDKLALDVDFRDSPNCRIHLEFCQIQQPFNGSRRLTKAINKFPAKVG